MRATCTVATRHHQSRSVVSRRLGFTASRPNSKPSLVEDPEPASRRFVGEHVRESYCGLTNPRHGLIAEANHDDARGGLRRMAESVREVSIERDENAVFRARYRQELLIDDAGQLLLAGKRHVMTAVTQYRGD